MKSMKLVVLISLILAVSACNTRKRDRTGVARINQKNNTTVNKTESLSYEFTINGCGTGKQQFTSIPEKCDGLQDATRNKGCALESRKTYFALECKNQTFKETNPFVVKTVTTEKTTPALSYDFSDDNGCSTGRQEFKTVAEKCIGLKDNGRNNGCAAEKRDKQFKEDCKE